MMLEEYADLRDTIKTLRESENRLSLEISHGTGRIRDLEVKVGELEDELSGATLTIESIYHILT